MELYFRHIKMTSINDQTIYVLFDSAENKYVSYNPFDDVYFLVEDFRQLKIWDWQYEEIAELCWKKTNYNILKLEVTEMKLLSIQ